MSRISNRKYCVTWVTSDYLSRDVDAGIKREVTSLPAPITNLNTPLPGVMELTVTGADDDEALSAIRLLAGRIFGSDVSFTVAEIIGDLVKHKTR